MAHIESPRPSSAEQVDTAKRDSSLEARPATKRSISPTSSNGGRGVAERDTNPAEGPRKRPKHEHNTPENKSLDEGEIDEVIAISDSDSDSDSVQEIVPPATARWNAGIRGVLRTSFAPNLSNGISKNKAGLEGTLPVADVRKRDVELTNQRIQETMLDTPTEPDRSSGESELEDDSRRGSIAAPSRAIRLLNHGTEYQVSALPGDATEIPSKSVWPQFGAWCQQFITQNSDNLGHINRDVLLAAYALFLKQLRTMSTRRRARAQTRARTHLTADRLKELIANAGFIVPEPLPDQQPKAKTAMDVPDAGESAPVLADGAGNGSLLVEDEVRQEADQANPGPPVGDELEYLDRYFPRVTGRDFCLICACPGHHFSRCTELSCRFCGQQGHLSLECPTRARCTKCKQLGHLRAACKEKLALAPGEPDECAFCQSTDHHDDDCEVIWRSFQRALNATREVKEIPAFCCSCGAAGHYGPECGLMTGGVVSHEDETWSIQIRDQYVNPESEEFAISWNPGTTLPPGRTGHERPDFGGRSIAPRTHVYFSDSESDGDGGFLRPSVPKPQGPGRIRINSARGSLTSRTNSLRNGAAATRPYGTGVDVDRATFVPPLPVGPPPSERSTGLPPRPPPVLAPARGGRGRSHYPRGPQRDRRGDQTAPRDMPPQGGRGAMQQPRGPRRGGNRGGRAR